MAVAPRLTTHRSKRSVRDTLPVGLDTPFLLTDASSTTTGTSLLAPAFSAVASSTTPQPKDSAEWDTFVSSSHASTYLKPARSHGEQPLAYSSMSTRYAQHNTVVAVQHLVLELQAHQVSVATRPHNVLACTVDGLGAATIITVVLILVPGLALWVVRLQKYGKVSARRGNHGELIPVGA